MMKKNKIVKLYTLLITILLITVACQEKDPYELVNDSKPLVVQANDFNLNVVEGSLTIGDTLGTVYGTSNRGSVNFELLSQTPTDAMDLDPLNGVLTVVNPDAFVANTQIMGVVEVEKDGVMDNLNINITVDEEMSVPCSDPIFNINLWLGDLDVEDVGYGTNAGVGLANTACNQLVITGDILAFGCDPSAQITLTFIPDSEGATTGTILAATPQPYDCDGTTDYSFVFPSGTYDENTGEILVDYEFYQDGNLSFPGQFRITSACTSTANTNIWSGNLNSEDVGYGSNTVVGTAGCGTLTIDGEIIAWGCAQDAAPQVTLTFIPDGADATSGTIYAPTSQAWDCDGTNISWLFPTGTYDETTAEILVDYEFYIDDQLAFPGQFRITPQ